MKTLLFAAAAAASLAFAAPVLAQDYAPTPPGTAALPGHDIRGQLQALRDRVKTGFDQGELSRSETDRLYRSIDRIRAVERSDRQSDGQLRDHDRTDLQGRIDTVSRSIHWRRAEGGAPAPVAVPVAVAVVETVPAAPPPPPAPLAWTLDQREDWLQGRIDRGVNDHHLSGHEATRGQGELHAIRVEQAQLTARDGGALSQTDHSYLADRLNQLNQTLKWEGRNPAAPWIAGS